MEVKLRERRGDDSEFIYNLFAEFKTDELQMHSWPEQMKKQLVNMQFTAHEQHYKTNFPDASDIIVLCDGERSGRLITFETDEVLHVADIIISVGLRGRGIGKIVLEQILDEAEKKGKRCRLNVNKGNRAIELYTRLGAKIISGDEMSFLMEFPEKVVRTV